jgi:hypothetical protein
MIVRFLTHTPCHHYTDENGTTHKMYYFSLSHKLFCFFQSPHHYVKNHHKDEADCETDGAEVGVLLLRGIVPSSGISSPIINVVVIIRYYYDLASDALLPGVINFGAPGT